MTDRVKISVMGITHSQIQKGAYAVLLTEDGGPHRIPVVVGIAEAQSIVAWMERQPAAPAHPRLVPLGDTRLRHQSERGVCQQV